MTVRPASSAPTLAIVPAKARWPASGRSYEPPLLRRIQTPTQRPSHCRGSSVISGGIVTPTGAPVAAVGSTARCVRAKRAPDSV